LWHWGIFVMEHVKMKNNKCTFVGEDIKKNIKITAFITRPDGVTVYEGILLSSLYTRDPKYGETIELEFKVVK